MLGPVCLQELLEALSKKAAQGGPNESRSTANQPFSANRKTMDKQQTWNLGLLPRGDSGAQDAILSETFLATMLESFGMHKVKPKPDRRESTASTKFHPKNLQLVRRRSHIGGRSHVRISLRRVE